MIKIGSLNIDKIYLGISDDVEVYLGTVKVWPEDVPPTPPSFNGKYKFTLTDDSVVSGECDSSSELTRSVTSAYTATMKEAVVGDCVTNIGNAAFRDCRSLTSIEIPNSVTTINNQTFWNCTSLTSCTIPSSVTSISGYAFYNCNSLPSITIPSSVASIADYAFQSCTSLSSITVDSNNANYLSENGVLFNKAKSTLIQYPIGNSLTSYSIPSGVTSISDSAFRNCRSLTSIDIPSGVTNISKEAFRDSRSLTSVTVNATTPPTLGTSAFAGTNNCPIYVPSASVAAYKSASRWSSYASRIEAIPAPVTLEWEQYYLGDTVPSSLFYGVKLGVIDIKNASIEFGDAINDYIGFAFDINSEEWYALDLSREQIDISEYYDETEECYVIYFSDLGLGAMPLYHPAPNESFEFDVQLYQEASLTSN